MANLIYRNQANKIFIYNSAEEVKNRKICINDEHIEPKNTSSITILTSGIPEYHIRIKNNFKSDIEDYGDVGDAMNSVKDKETKPCKTEFSMNEDVLLKSLDDKLYLGTVVNIQNGKYLVKFDDNTEKWSCERGLKKLNSSLTENDDEPMCVVCKERSDTDVVEVCHKCSRGYHRQCLKDTSSNFSSPWCCNRCTASEIISISDSEDAESDDVPNLLKLSYDISSLKWDTHHKENKEQIYCYCGKTGSWKIQMMQCCKCQQWFHEKCTSVFKGFFMQGDTFYVFCCKLCNDGSEFLNRANFSWKTAVHLVLYEMTMTRPQKYYSISREVAPFIWEKWDELNFPLAKFQTEEKLIKKVMQTVKQEDEFKSIGAKHKQKTDLVCLRRKTPPVSMKISIPSSMIVCEKTLKKLSIKTFPLNDETLPLKKKAVEPPKPMKTEVDEKPAKENRRKKTNRLSSDDSKMSTPSILSIVDDSSDETSSRSALDWIIPPPSNFRGKNNPFHSQYRPHAKFKTCEKGLRKGQQTAFDKLPEIRIVRTIKRRLSAKDIAMSSNKEAKRRKFMKRRKSSDVEIISEIIQPIHMPLPPFYSVRNVDARDSNGDFKFKSSFESNKMMRRNSRSTKTSNESSRRSSIEAYSETKNSINVTEAVMNSPLKNKSINLYFGALNRVENGEKFTILAKRMTFEGKEQYLLDWEAPKGAAPSNQAANQ